MRRLKSIAIVILFSLFPTACGGGTTGTSPTGDLRLQGSVFTSSGAAVARTAMSVLPDDNSALAVTATTDQEGAFDMSLDGDVSRFSIEITDHASPSFTRAYQEASIVSALVIQENSGQISLPSVVEAQVDNNRLCSQITSEDNTIFISGDVLDSSCVIPLNINFTQSTKIQYQVMVEGVCNQKETIFSQLPVTQSGLWEVQLPKSLEPNCAITSLSIESDDGLHQIRFPIVFSD
jgi:hypothetical protein